MGKKSAPPPAPDYTQAAEKTAASSQDAQTRADWANRPTQTTPWGQSSWSSSAATDPATGKPVTNWEQNITLSGDQQKALDDQMSLQSGRSDIAGGMMNRLGEDYSKPYDWSGMQEHGAAPATGMAERLRAENMMMDRMRPEHQFQQSALESRVGNMGFARGSEGWNREMQRLGDQQSRERFNAFDRGLQEQQGQFGMNLQGAEYQNKLRQQQIAEQMQKRGMTLNEMNALLSGQQVNMPGMPSFNTSQSAGGANYSGAARDQYGAGMDSYNAKQQQQQSMMSGIGQVAGVAGMMMMSDARLKSNIVRVGEHPLGIGIYEFDIQGQRERGVLAQEVLEVAPHLVHQHRSGYLMVNYGGLQ